MQIGCTEQQGVAIVRQDIVGHILISIFDIEIVDDLLTGSTDLFPSCLDIGPRGVGIVVIDAEFHGLAIFLIDDGHLVLRTLVVRHFYHLTQVSSYAIGTEVDDRQRIDAINRINQKSDAEEGRHNPIDLRTDEVRLHPIPSEHDDCCAQQHDILQQGLGVGQDDGIAKATTVAHRIGDGDIDRQ